VTSNVEFPEEEKKLSGFDKSPQTTGKDIPASATIFTALLLEMVKL